MVKLQKSMLTEVFFGDFSQISVIVYVYMHSLLAELVLHHHTGVPIVGRYLSLEGPREVHLTHKTIEPFSWWNISELAGECGYSLLGALLFDRCLYPGYVNRKALDKKSFPCTDAQVRTNLNMKLRCVTVVCKRRTDVRIPAYTTASTNKLHDEEESATLRMQPY